MNKYNIILEFNKNNRTIFGFIIVLSIIFITLLEQRLSNSPPQTYQKINNGSSNKSVQAEVLLIYVYSKTHSKAHGNLKYFIENAVRENDGVDYYFILQNVDNKIVNESELPLLPKTNAHYIQHENVCFDFGTVGWFLNTYTVGNPWINQTNIDDKEKKINITQYKYFIMINSSVRGPFFPPYYLKFVADYKKEFEKMFYWYYVFTKRITAKVKLVGVTISCIPIPHVQSYVLVTDFVGLKILLQPGAHGGSGSNGIFGCYAVKNDVSYLSEVASSTRVLGAGYMIDCLLTKYQQVDFTIQQNRDCNKRANPYLERNLEGTQIDPYEAVFMKYNDTPDTQFGKKRCELYEKWMEDVTKRNRSDW